MTVTKVDALVIGGGFYGCTIATTLAASHQHVALLEAGSGLLGRASFANQARVHAGYHYPRSVLTALRSSVNFARFVGEYPECIDKSFTKLYAIARGPPRSSRRCAKGSGRRPHRRLKSIASGSPTTLSKRCS